MARTVWKFPIKPEFTLSLAPTAVVRLVDAQGDVATMWIETDPDAGVMEERWFRVFGTGHEISDHWSWVASWQQPPFVWHLYEYRGATQ